MTTLPTLVQQIACIQRELRMRHLVYPNRVSKGSMTQWEMDREIACMQAVLANLQEQNRQPSLFEGKTP